MNPPLSSLTLPNLTVNGDSLGNVQLVLGQQRADAVRGYQRHRPGQCSSSRTDLPPASCRSIAVNGQNRVVGTFSNGQNIPLAQVTLANFNGQDGLQALNGGAYAATSRFRAAAVLGDRPDRGQLGRRPPTSISPPSSVI